MIGVKLLTIIDCGRTHFRNYEIKKALLDMVLGTKDLIYATKFGGIKNPYIHVCFNILNSR